MDNSDNGNASSTYQRTNLLKSEILINHRSVLSSFGVNTALRALYVGSTSKFSLEQCHDIISTTFQRCSNVRCPLGKDDDIDLPSLYRIPKLHKDPYKQRFIAGSSCSTKPLSKILTSILTAVKEGLKKYCDVIYSHSGINQMWILKNSKELLDNLQSHSLISIHSIKTYDLSTLYTTIPHTKLKSRLSELIKIAFRCKNGKSVTNMLWSGIILHTLLRTPPIRNIKTQRTTLLGCLIF